jgi:serine/threonine-protein kinase
VIHIPSARLFGSIRVAVLGLTLFGVTACEGPSADPPPDRRHAATRPASRRPRPAPRIESGEMVAVPAGRIETLDPHGDHVYRDVPAFSLDRTEVTVREYWRCVSGGACRPHWSSLRGECNMVQLDKRDHPMNCIGREQAQQYCRWRGKRLPTLAEWQLAAEGSAQRPHPWGGAPPDEERLCWQSDGTCDVASHAAGDTPLGLHDMAGNVWEISETACEVKPPRPGMCGSETAVVHGGGWDSCASHQPSCSDAALSRRVALLPDIAPEAVGFRCAR